MATVDRIMDLAIRGVRNHFGRPVAYQVQGVGPTVDLTAHYVREKREESPGTRESVSTTADVLDVRVADLEAANIRPRQRDVVTFDGQTWTVVDVQPGDLGTVYLTLGRRT